jgi:hypothetical protein
LKNGVIFFHPEKNKRVSADYLVVIFNFGDQHFLGRSGYKVGQSVDIDQRMMSDILLFIFALP